MRKNDWTPSIAPGGDEQTVYLVAEDLGKLGRAWREADHEATDWETVLQDLMSGQYNNPIRVVAFNTKSDGRRTFPKTWLTNCVGAAMARALPSSIQDFVERHEGHAWRQFSLRLV
jgi:hypothetical protein